MFKLNGNIINLGEFPDGTPSLKIKAEGPVATIEWLYEKNEEILLYYIVNHLRAYGRVKELHLVMPYIPNARLDRIEEGDEETVFTLKYFCNFINSLEFDSVTVRDAHSYVSFGMLNNVVPEPVGPIIRGLIEDLFAGTDKETIVFFPDEGASKRYAKKIDYRSCFGIKVREKGKVESLEVKGNLPQESFDVLIVDDICSYGGTFLKAAQALKKRGADNIYLYITHCENNILKGDLIKSGLIKKIYTTHSIFTGEHDLIEVIGGNENA